MTISAPPKHFRPQTDRAQKSVIRKINDAERTMIPPGFDAEMVQLDAIHTSGKKDPIDPQTSDRRFWVVDAASEGTRSAQALAQVPLARLDDQHIARRTNRVRAGTVQLVTDSFDPYAHSQAELQSVRLQVARAEAETRARDRRRAGTAHHTPLTSDPYRLDCSLPTLTAAINPDQGLHRIATTPTHTRPSGPIVSPPVHKGQEPGENLSTLGTAALTIMLALAIGGTLYTVAEPIFQLLPVVGQWFR